MLDMGFEKQINEIFAALPDMGAGGKTTHGVGTFLLISAAHWDTRAAGQCLL